MFPKIASFSPRLYNQALFGPFDPFGVPSLVSRAYKVCRERAGIVDILKTCLQVNAITVLYLSQFTFKSQLVFASKSAAAHFQMHKIDFPALLSLSKSYCKSFSIGVSNLKYEPRNSSTAFKVQVYQKLSRPNDKLKSREAYVGQNLLAI